METGRAAVLVDQHPLWLDAVTEIIGGLGFTVRGKLSSAEVALELIEDLDPDLVIVGDLPARGTTAPALIRELWERMPEVRVIVLSADDGEDAISAALAAGASAYVLKRVEPDELAAAIRHVFSPSIFLPSASTIRLDQRGGRDDQFGAALTRREIEILQLVSEGYSNAQLAKMLWVTEQTVKFHLSNIYRKLEVSNRTEASRWAQLNGLLDTAERATIA
ncbi:MAG: response regulator transcription factor [Thermoleophilia bacterium]